MRAGAQHMILGIPGHAAPEQVPEMVREVAVPLADVAMAAA
jgi:hypothetical protein